MAHFQATASRSQPHLPFQNCRPLRLILLTCVALLSGSRTAQAQDGRAILLKAMHFYHSFHSYMGQANLDTLMLAQNGQTVKHIGSSTALEFQRPNKIYIFLQNPLGSRAIYGDGTHFSVYEATPDQYLTVPMTGKQQDLLTLLRVHGNVVAGFDTLFFLMQTSLPNTLTHIQLQGPSSYNGHPVYVVTGMTNATPAGSKSGAATPASYWTWWIDRSSYLLYKVETKTPNVVKPVSFGAGQQTVIKNIKGTVVMRYTVSGIKPDANLAASDFVFTPPKTAMRRRTVQEVLHGKN